jgi:hypothetical protein
MSGSRAWCCSSGRGGARADRALDHGSGVLGMRIQPAGAGIAPLVHREVPQVPGLLDSRLASFRPRGFGLAAAGVDDRGHDRHELGRLHGRSIRKRQRGRNCRVPATFGA